MTIEDHYRVLAPKLTNWLVATGSSYHEACDLVQSTFLKVWKMKDDLREDDTAVSGLVFTIARNLRKNLVRDNSRLSFVPEIRDPDDDGETVDGGGVNGRVAALSSQAQDSSTADTAKLRRRLREAFGKLPPILRDAYTMFQIGEMSIREIANQTGVSESLVKVRIFRAKEKLKEILSDLRVTF